MNQQELLNAIYSGPFVTKAREEYSNSSNANVQKWKAYIKGEANRQEILQTAFKWVSKGDIENYMSIHRNDTSIDELKRYFNSVIDWVSNVFVDVKSEMRGIEWGELYEKYHLTPYDPTLIHNELEKLYYDEYVKNKRGIFEFLLGGSIDSKLLEVRIFDENVKKAVYKTQTDNAKNNNTSNCPLCALGNDSNKMKIWDIKEMDADHVTAWSKGGATDISNCQMLCSTHNRAKGNR